VITDKEEEAGWWTGRIGDRVGLFPSTYVEVIEQNPLPVLHRNEPVEGQVLVAHYDYNEGGAEELAFSVGDRIVLQAKDESGWWLGKLQHSGVVGWFAPDLVAPVVEEQHAEGGAPQSAQSQKKPFSFDESEVAASYESLPASPKKAVFRVNKHSGYQPNHQQATPPLALDDAPKQQIPQFTDCITPKSSTSELEEKEPSSSKKANPPSAKRTKKQSHSKPPPKGLLNSTSNQSKAQPPPKEESACIVISYEKLKAKQFGDHKVDREKLEQYLSDDKFVELFKMTKSEFAVKPVWKQKSIKKTLGLF